MTIAELVERLENSNGFLRRKNEHKLTLVHCLDCSTVGWVNPKKQDEWLDLAAVCLKLEGTNEVWRYSPHTPEGKHPHECASPEMVYFSELPEHLLKRLAYAYETEEVPA